jgi:hypothetical protein
MLLQMPRGGKELGISNIPTFKPENLLTPVESALPRNSRVAHSESALPKTLDLKPFKIRTYKKGWGRVQIEESLAFPVCAGGPYRRDSNALEAFDLAEVEVVA